MFFKHSVHWQKFNLRPCSTMLYPSFLQSNVSEVVNLPHSSYERLSLLRIPLVMLPHVTSEHIYLFSVSNRFFKYSTTLFVFCSPFLNLFKKCCFPVDTNQRSWLSETLNVSTLNCFKLSSCKRGLENHHFLFHLVLTQCQNFLESDCTVLIIYEFFRSNSTHFMFSGCVLV